MDTNMFTGIPTNTVVTEKEVTFAYDYKYADVTDIQNVTRGQLAKLEVDLHSLRMAVIANGGDESAVIGPNRTLATEIARVNEAINTLESYFSEVLEA